MAKRKPVPPVVKGFKPYPRGSAGYNMAQEALGKQREAAKERTAQNKLKLENLRKVAGRNRKLRTAGKVALGLGAAGLVGGKVLGMYRDEMVLDAIRDIQGRQNEIALAASARQAQEQSYQSAINRNLDTVMRYAPDLYASVAAGRKLPQGGVVIGGEPRQDLLNELGRSMADGRFSR
jgi:hypothetical protein